MKRTASAFITYRNKVLLLHRDNIPTISDPDKWSVVGGNVEEGETVDEGMRREIREESNLSPRNLKYLGKMIIGDHEVSAYTAELDADEVKNIELGDEGSEIKFFTFDELQTLDLANNLKYYLKKYPESARKLIEGKIVDPEELGLSS